MRREIRIGKVGKIQQASDSDSGSDSDSCSDYENLTLILINQDSDSDSDKSEILSLILVDQNGGEKGRVCDVCMKSIQKGMGIKLSCSST